MKVALGQPRRFRLRSVWRGLAIPFVLALVFSACGSRMSHRAVVDATRGGGTRAAGSATGTVDESGNPVGGEASTGTAAGTATGGGTSTAAGGGAAGGTGGGTAGGGAGGAVTHGTLSTVVIGSVGNYSGPPGASEADGPRAL